MEYLSVSLLVREEVYPESLPDPAGANLLGRHHLNLIHGIPWCESLCPGGSLPRIPPCSGKTKLIGKAHSQVSSLIFYFRFLHIIQSY
jgi:hypothetical protein